MTRIAILALAASVGGCAMEPRYAVPKPPAALAEPYDNAPSATPLDEGALETWWTVLSDPTLDALVADVLAHNLDIEEAKGRLRQVRAQRRVVRSDGLPTLNAAGLAQRQRFSENITFGAGGGPPPAGGAAGGASGGPPGGGQADGGQSGGGQQGGGFGDASSLGMPASAFDFFQGSFDASWEVDLFGGVAQRVRAADARVDRAVLAIADVRTSLIAEFVRDYLVVREIQERLALARTTLATAERTAGLSREKERAGLVTVADTTRTDAEVLAARALVPQLDVQLRQAAQRMAVLAGREPGAYRRTLDVVRAIPAAGPVATGIPSELLLRRPDIRGAERLLAAATHEVSGAVRDLYPRLSFNAAVGSQADSVGSLFDWSSRFYRLAANLTAPIFDGGRRRADIERRRGEVDEALANYRRTVLTAFREVEDALVAYDRNMERVRLGAQTVERRQRASSVLREQYRAGLVALIDVLAAERDLTSAQNAQANARAAVVVEWVALQKALGGGWAYRGNSPEEKQ